MNAYQEFLESKSRLASGSGIDIDSESIHPSLYGFQKKLVMWSLAQGRSAVFADCGLGKTRIQLEWARLINEHARKPVLILTPLAVAQQTVQEGAYIGVPIMHSRSGEVSSGITVTNYERLHYFDSHDFGAVVADESSLLKNFDGKRKAQITEFMRRMPYRLLCTATAAPNDYTELGTSSEALGYLGHIDMLNQFFTNKNNTSDLSGRGFHGTRDAWRFKAHAEPHFWRWVASWARALRKPSDMGFDDDGFILPELKVNHHVIETRVNWSGQLFPKVAESLQEQRKERRATLEDRCKLAAELVEHGKPAVIWCHLNDEADLLEKLIPDAVQVQGKDSLEWKETVAEWFKGKTCVCNHPLFRLSEQQCICGHKSGRRILISKPLIYGWGQNWQHCAHVVYMVSDSYEQYYQAVRRCWRFGQKNPVIVDVISSEGDARTLERLERKSEQASKMFDSLIGEMYNPAYHKSRETTNGEVDIPAWLNN